MLSKCSYKEIAEEEEDEINEFIFDHIGPHFKETSYCSPIEIFSSVEGIQDSLSDIFSPLISDTISEFMSKSLEKFDNKPKIFKIQKIRKILKQDIYDTGNEDSQKFLGQKRNKGRKTMIEKTLMEGTGKHNKMSKDNIIGKIQTNYLKFIVAFINLIIEQILGDNIHRFVKISHPKVRVVNSGYVEILKKMTLYEILEKMEISSKFKNHSDDHNQKTLIEICQLFPQMEKFLKETKYLQLFKPIYFRDYENYFERKVDMSKFGIDFILDLNNTKKRIETKDDLLRKNKGDKNYIEYMTEMEKIANKEYATAGIFRTKTKLKHSIGATKGHKN